MARGRQYSDEQKAAALAALKANGGNISKTARELCINRTTLMLWIPDESAVSVSVSDGVNGRMTPEKKPPQLTTPERVAIILPEAERTLADELEDVAALHLKRAKDQEAINKLPADRAVIGACAAIDKSRLLRGQPTSVAVTIIWKAADDYASRTADELERLYRQAIEARLSLQRRSEPASAGAGQVKEIPAPLDQ